MPHFFCRATDFGYTHTHNGSDSRCMCIVYVCGCVTRSLRECSCVIVIFYHKRIESLVFSPFLPSFSVHITVNESCVHTRIHVHIFIEIYTHTCLSHFSRSLARSHTHAHAIRTCIYRIDASASFFYQSKCHFFPQNDSFFHHIKFNSIYLFICSISNEYSSSELLIEQFNLLVYHSCEKLGSIQVATSFKKCDWNFFHSKGVCSCHAHIHIHCIYVATEFWKYQCTPNWFQKKFRFIMPYYWFGITDPSTPTQRQWFDKEYFPIIVCVYVCVCESEYQFLAEMFNSNNRTSLSHHWICICIWISYTQWKCDVAVFVDFTLSKMAIHRLHWYSLHEV